MDRNRSDNRTKKIDWATDLSSDKGGVCMTQFNGRFISEKCGTSRYSLCQKPKLGKYTNINC